jgi:hypothetical protein
LPLLRSSFSRTLPFDYLTELQKHVPKLAKTPTAWMPWNYRETLQQQPGPSKDLLLSGTQSQAPDYRRQGIR